MASAGAVQWVLMNLKDDLVGLMTRSDALTQHSTIYAISYESNLSMALSFSKRTECKAHPEEGRKSSGVRSLCRVYQLERSTVSLSPPKYPRENQSLKN